MFTFCTMCDIDNRSRGTNVVPTRRLGTHTIGSKKECLSLFQLGTPTNSARRATCERLNIENRHIRIIS